LDDKGDLIGYRGVDADITERKKMLDELILAKEKAVESDRLKTAFINNISHEIRTPLNGILGFGQFLAESELTPEKRKEYYSILEKSSNRLMNTVNDYMDMARIVSGTMEVNKKEFSLQPLVEEIIEKYEKLCAEKEINFLVITLEKSLDIKLYSDQGFVQKILNILLDNALKFTKTGGIKFGYLFVPGFIEFVVQDTGVGIEQDKMDTIFDMFTQEDTSNIRGHEGSGLGLSIARGLVSLLGGSINVSSSKGKGSTFTFTVPYNLADNLLKEQVLKKGETHDANKKLILIAEDEESNYIFIEEIFKRTGYAYLHVWNGAEAVEICQQNKSISMVLMDIKMPVMNGIEATQLIHTFRPDLPIIATTAYAQTGDEQRFLTLGFNGYLAKPIKKDNLISLLNKYI
jgi:CheY-like chemotaxis protein